MIDLCIEPRVVKSWDQFRKENPRYSMALDDYVNDRPLFDADGPYINFDHHHFVDRLSTRSTAGQVYLAIKQGLFERFSESGIPHAQVYVNDADYDVCVAWWLLKNHERITGIKSEPLITKLVGITDYMDATGGLYPLDPNTTLMRERAWIFEPYSEARLTGRILLMREGEMRNVIDSVTSRIDKHLLGRGEEKTVDTRYDKIGGGENWMMVREIGAEARGKMVIDGIKAFVSVREVDETHYAYTLARVSAFIPFPIPDLFDDINLLEGYSLADPQRWGGSDIIGGSSRTNNTTIKPEELERMINEFLRRKK